MDRKLLKANEPAGSIPSGIDDRGPAVERHRRALLAVWLCAVSPIVAADALALATLPRDLTQLSLADLMNIEVTSVSRRVETLQHAAAAVFVLTGDEIHRSGARSIAEVLRRVPGLHVARNSELNTYAVSSRGFADRLSDKLEVLIDGRTVYTPLFGGVFWDSLDTLLPDIERIEVIRGPGAALWGANAFNGVINIVTKSAADTTGRWFRAGGGTGERNFAELRGGTAIGTDGHGRLYAKHFERDPLRRRDGSDATREQRSAQAGFRTDWSLDAAQRLTVSGDVHDTVRGGAFGDIEVSGGNVLGRWVWRSSAGSELTLHGFYDQTDRLIPQTFEEERKIGNLELEHRLAIVPSHSVIYGIGYRNSRDTTGGPPLFFSFAPSSATLHYYHGFVQDQIRLSPTVEVTLGTKVEHNEFTGFELQPSARLGWRLGSDTFTWAAVSRAVKTPTRVDNSVVLLGTFRTGNPELGTQKMLAYEWGMRFWSGQRLSADLALFHHDYDDLRSSEPAPGNPFGVFRNGLEGHGSGGELALAWQPAEMLDLRLSYSALDLHLDNQPGSSDVVSRRRFEGSSPEHQAGLRAHWQPAPRWQANGFFRYVSALRSLNVPAYSELSLRLAYRPRDAVEVALVGENLLDAQHLEFGMAAYHELARSALVELTWVWD